MNQNNINQENQAIVEPIWLAPKFENIHLELQKQPWAVWKAEPRLDHLGNPTGKWNKAPRNPVTGVKVGANQPEKFGTFDEAKKAYASGAYTGIGILLTGNGLVGIDIDNVRQLIDDKREIMQWLYMAIADKCYCELSPSATGLRLFTLGALNSLGRKHNSFEIYEKDRFLTLTGHIYSEETQIS